MRAKELAKSHMFSMVIIRVYDFKGIYEQVVHDALESYRVCPQTSGSGLVNGCEWYKITEDAIVDAVENIINQPSQG